MCSVGPAGPADRHPPALAFWRARRGADPQNVLGAAVMAGHTARQDRQEAAKPATEDSRKSSVEREGGTEWIGGLFNRPGDAFVPLTWEAINVLYGVGPRLYLNLPRTPLGSLASLPDDQLRR